LQISPGHLEEFGSSHSERCVQIRAAAAVFDVALPETSSGGIEVPLEHADGPAISVLEPYTVSDGEVRAEPLEGPPHSA